MNIYAKQKQTDKFREQIYGYQGKWWGEGTVREFGTDMYTFLCLKQINTNVVLYNMGNSAQ